MINNNYTHLNIPRKINNNCRRNSMNEDNSSKKKNNIFRKNLNYPNRNKANFHKVNMHQSIMNSSAPYNFYKSPKRKNEYLICFNGGPKQTFFTKKSVEPTIEKYSEKYEYFNNEKRSCGCLSKCYFPSKIKKLIYRPNNINNESDFFKKVNLTSKDNKLVQRDIFGNNRYMTPKTIRIGNDGKIILNLRNFKKVNYNTNGIYKHLRYERHFKNGKFFPYYNNNSIFNSTFDNTFHKTQIFDHCKPFLAEESKDFPYLK